MIFLKQSTATTIVVGPFVSTTDGYTAKTALTISQAKSLLWKQGGTTFGAKNESTAGTHRSNGCYTLPLDATDTNTLGQLTVSIDDSANGALPVRHDFMVLPANVYDSLVSTDKLQVDVVELNSVAASAAKLERSASTMVLGTVDTASFSATTTEFEAADITEATADHYKGLTLKFSSAAVDDQGTSITAYSLVGGKGHFTVSALTEAPPNGATFVIF